MRTPFDAPVSQTPAVRPADVPLTEGMYDVGGDVYRVQRSSGGHLYAKYLNPETKKFEYAPGEVKRIDIRDRMTLEQGKEYSAKLGVCCVCAATLSAKKSVAAGIGPICATKF